MKVFDGDVTRHNLPNYPPLGERRLLNIQEMDLENISVTFLKNFEIEIRLFTVTINKFHNLTLPLTNMTGVCIDVTKEKCV